jgi:hypothetical protein
MSRGATYSAFFVLASVLLIQAFAFPWLETKNRGDQMASMKHGLGAMTVGEDLSREILGHHVQRKPELRDREAQGSKNVARSFVGAIGSVIGGLFDIVVGDVGNIVGAVESLADSMHGSERLLEVAYSYQAPDSTVQRGKQLLFY